jgi:cell division septation protein DedD
MTAACALLALLAAACSGGASTSTPPVAGAQSGARHLAHPAASGGNVVADPGFESGGFSAGWTSCGTVAAKVTTAQAHSGSYSALSGAISKPEINGTAGVCQTITVPAGATLTLWVYEGTNDTIKYVDQEGDIRNTSGTVLTNLFKEATTTGGWVERTYSLSAYAGQTVQLYFGIVGNGYASDYVYQYVDDVSVTGSGTATPTPSPTATPTVSPTATPTGKPTASPTASPTAKPTATPTAAPTATPTTNPGLPTTCNDPQFLTYQSEFGSGSISADQLVDVCGLVTSVLPSKTSSSGTHGYFYVQIPNGGTIEIVSNLTAMAEASTDKPPSTWPWVAVGNYVYVQGRYYYDNSSSQGIDWTEDDTDSSWSHTGYVVVCPSGLASCAGGSKYW